MVVIICCGCPLREKLGQKAAANARTANQAHIADMHGTHTKTPHTSADHTQQMPHASTTPICQPHTGHSKYRNAMQVPLPSANHTWQALHAHTDTQAPAKQPPPLHPTAAMHLHAAAAGQQHSTSPLLPAARSRCSPPPALHLFTAAASNLPPAPSSQVPAANRQLPRPPAAHCRPVPVLQHTALSSTWASPPQPDM